MRGGHAPGVVQAVVRGDKIIGTEVYKTTRRRRRSDDTVAPCVFSGVTTFDNPTGSRAIKGRHEPLHLAFYTRRRRAVTEFQKSPGVPIPIVIMIRCTKPVAFACECLSESDMQIFT